MEGRRDSIYELRRRKDVIACQRFRLLHETSTDSASDSRTQKSKCCFHRIFTYIGMALDALRLCLSCDQASCVSRQSTYRRWQPIGMQLVEPRIEPRHALAGA